LHEDGTAVIAHASWGVFFRHAKSTRDYVDGRRETKTTVKELVQYKCEFYQPSLSAATATATATATAMVTVQLQLQCDAQRSS
jgi:hypothetical protein